MSLIGHLVTLPVLRVERERLVLDGGPEGEIPPPRGELGAGARGEEVVRGQGRGQGRGDGAEAGRAPTGPADPAVGDALEVFVLSDADARPLATTRRPLATLGQCASLEVAALAPAGAFLDWGLPKNLLLPFAEQRRPLEVGQRECVQVYRDNSGRLAASARLDHRLAETPGGFTAWQPVELLVCQRTDLGFKAVVDDRAIGLLYRDEIFTDVRVGLRLPGFVKRPRPDGRLDLALQPPAREVRDDLAGRILAHLAAHGGASSLTDRSSPEAIRDAFGVSKKNYKRALGALYRERRVRLEPDRVVLVDGPPA